MSPEEEGEEFQEVSDTLKEQVGIYWILSVTKVCLCWNACCYGGPLLECVLLWWAFIRVCMYV